MEQQLPHSPGGLLAQFVPQQIPGSTTSVPALSKQANLSTQHAQEQYVSQTIGISQSTGNSLVRSPSGGIQQIASASGFGDQLLVSGAAQPSNPTAVFASSPAQQEVPSLTIITNSEPPISEVTCPDSPVFASGVVCPPGFEPIPVAGGFSGCRQIAEPIADIGGYADPAFGVLVSSVAGGCNGLDGKEWYKDQQCPLGSEELDLVEFNGFTYRLCRSDSPLPPGVGCGWKYGNLVSNCATFDGCLISLENYGFGVFSSFESYESTEFFEQGRRAISVKFNGNSSYGNSMPYLYFCSPAKSGVLSVTYRLLNVKVEATCGGTVGCGQRLYAIALQNGQVYYGSFGNPDSVSSTHFIYNRTSTEPMSTFKKAEIGTTGMTSGLLNTNDPIFFGIGWGTSSDDYFLPPIQPGPEMAINFGPGSEMRFNY